MGRGAWPPDTGLGRSCGLKLPRPDSCSCGDSGDLTTTQFPFHLPTLNLACQIFSLAGDYSAIPVWLCTAVIRALNGILQYWDAFPQKTSLTGSSKDLS